MPLRPRLSVGALLLLAAVSYAALATLAWLFQRRLIYLPFPRAVPPVASTLPGAMEVSFRTEDGLDLAGWFSRPPGLDPTPAVLVLNGNAGNRSMRAPLAEALVRAGFAVLLFDYRGYARNPGQPSEKGLLADARAARDWLKSRPEVDAGRIALFGESLGAAVAAASAAEDAPAALVLRSPFRSLVDVGRLHYPFLPVGLLLSDRFPVADRVAQIHCPILVVAGERDAIVPLAQSREVFEAAAAVEKRFVAVPGADHNDWELLGGAALIDEVVEFLREAFRAP